MRVGFKEFVYARAVVEGVGMGFGAYLVLTKNYEIAINSILPFLIIHLILDGVACKMALEENKL